MINRFAALWVVLGFVAGYALFSPASKAQGFIGLPFAGNTNDKITLQFERGTITDSVVSIDCTVDEVQTTWIRCRAGDSFQSQRQQRWYNLKHVVEITRQTR
jgi:hypothetical protein